jgi:hypothetical protein
VDDSVLSLTGYKVSSPLELFYPKRNVGFLWDFFDRSLTFANVSSE